MSKPIVFKKKLKLYNCNIVYIVSKDMDTNVSYLEKKFKITTNKKEKNYEGLTIVSRDGLIILPNRPSPTYFILLEINDNLLDKQGVIAHEILYCINSLFRATYESEESYCNLLTCLLDNFNKKYLKKIKNGKKKEGK